LEWPKICSGILLFTPAKLAGVYYETQTWSFGLPDVKVFYKILLPVSIIADLFAKTSFLPHNLLTQTGFKKVNFAK
jgi:hypothetical protein